MAYSKEVLEHFEKPRNIGSLDSRSNRVGTGLVGAPECGDVMKLQIEVDDNNKIIDAKFKTFGCGSAIAASSLATEWIKNKTVDEASMIQNTEIVKDMQNNKNTELYNAWREDFDKRQMDKKDIWSDERLDALQKVNMADTYA